MVDELLVEGAMQVFDYDYKGFCVSRAVTAHENWRKNKGGKKVSW